MALSLKSQQFYRLLESTFEASVSGAVLIPDGTLLHLQYAQLADIGTLPLAGRLAGQYLQLKPHQIAIMNDPYSGGTLLSTITLITGISLTPKNGSKSDLLLALRIPLRPRLKLAVSVDEEGLRIPPTPIADEKHINLELLKVMAEHPLSSEGLYDRTISGIENLRRLSRNFVRAFEIFGISFSKTLVTNYLAESTRIMKSVIADYPIGDSRAQVSLRDDSKIKVHVEFTGEKVLIDFSGTSAPKMLSLTDGATFGACFGALLTVFDRQLPLNAGTLDHLEVRTPSGTLLNAKYPAPTFLGMTDGVVLTANLVLRAIGQVVPKRQIAMSSAGQCALDIEFENGQHFFDTTAPGVGASSEGRGEDALSFWTRSHLQASIEEIEKRFPIKISQIVMRENSGGKGLNRGGDGLIKVFELKASAQICWALEPAVKVEGSEGGASGSEAEIIFTKKDGTREKAGPYGKILLAAGDHITIHSAGGGSFGRSKDIA